MDGTVSAGCLCNASGAHIVCCEQQLQQCKMANTAHLSLLACCRYGHRAILYPHLRQASNAVGKQPTDKGVDAVLAHTSENQQQNDSDSTSPQLETLLNELRELVCVPRGFTCSTVQARSAFCAHMACTALACVCIELISKILPSMLSFLLHRTYWTLMTRLVAAT
jgi:hypothetical protein